MTHHFIYWLGTGWWCLGLVHASPSSSAVHAFAVIWRLVCTFCHALLASYGVGCFSICHSLWLASFGDWALLDHGPSFPHLILCTLCGLVRIFLPYHSAVLAIMLLDSILLGLFGRAVYFSPSDSMYSLGLFLHCLWAPVSHFPLRHPWPIWFPWGFLGPFPILLSHGPLLTLLGFSGLITLYFILGADGFSIGPLLSLLILLWVYCGPFSLFYIMPMGLLSLSFQAYSSLLASSGPTLWACEPFIPATWAQWLFLAC